MINALRAQRLAAAHAPFDAWLYASDVVRNFPWSSWSRVSDAAWADDAGQCAAPLLAPTGPAAGANCVFLLPTPYELQAPPPPRCRPSARIRERRPSSSCAPTTRGTGSAPCARARPEHAWLNVSVVGRGVERVAFSEFARYRYLLDVGGVSGRRGARCAPSCQWLARLQGRARVARLVAPHLQPFRDYLPVSVDLSDLHERYRWAEAHPQAAERIARSGARRRRHERPARDARRRGVGADQRGGGRARHHGHGAAGVWHAAASV